MRLATFNIENLSARAKHGPLVDAYGLGVFDVGPRPGTFEACSLANRPDYVLLSPELAALVTAGGIN